MFRRDVLAGLGALPLCAAFAATPARRTIVYIGTHGDRILAATLDPATGAFTPTGTAAPLARPTWLAIDPARHRLFSTSETGNDGKSHGTVHGFAIDARAGTLTPIGAADGGGGGTTYISHAPAAATVFASNYGDGAVAAIAVLADGRLAPPASVVKDFGTGPNPKQNTPHAHGAIPAPGGRFVVVPDMGADRIFVYAFDPARRTLAPAATPFVQTEPGTGPRHAVFSRDGRFLYVVTELSAEVRVFGWSPARGELTPMQTIRVDAPGFTGTPSAAEIALGLDGRFLYVSNRAANTIVAFAVDRRQGGVTRLQEVSCGGEKPRTFGIDPSGRWMLVGNEISKTVVVLAIDRASGRLTPAGGPVRMELDPVAFAFYPL